MFEFDAAIEQLKGRDIREFRIIYLKDFGKAFSSPRKFVDVIEAMLKDYYKGVIQHLTKWEPKAPKLESKKEPLDEERFIEDVNSGVWPIETDANESMKPLQKTTEN